MSDSVRQCQIASDKVRQCQTMSENVKLCQKILSENFRQIFNNTKQYRTAAYLNLVHTWIFVFLCPRIWLWSKSVSPPGSWIGLVVAPMEDEAAALAQHAGLCFVLRFLSNKSTCLLSCVQWCNVQLQENKTNCEVRTVNSKIRRRSTSSLMVWPWWKSQDQWFPCPNSMTRSNNLFHRSQFLLNWSIYEVLLWIK